MITDTEKLQHILDSGMVDRIKWPPFANEEYDPTLADWQRHMREWLEEKELFVQPGWGGGWGLYRQDDDKVEWVTDQCWPNAAYTEALVAAVLAAGADGTDGSDET